MHICGHQSFTRFCYLQTCQYNVENIFPCTCQSIIFLQNYKKFPCCDFDDQNTIYVEIQVIPNGS